MKRILLRLVVASLLGVATPTLAAKLIVVWNPVTINTDGTPIKDLAGYRVEWGSCGPNNTFGTYQAGINVPASMTRTAIYPTGLSSVCARMFAYNTLNIFSGATNTIRAVPPSVLSQPIH